MQNIPHRFPKTLLAIASAAALLPISTQAVDLVQAPPGTVQPYVTPNVIISIDDSGSMNYRLDTESSSKATNNTKPNDDGTWPATSRRMNVLKYSLSSIFDPTHEKYDSTLIPDKKIRLAWQSMWNNGKSPGVGIRKTSGNTTSTAGANSVYNGTNTPTVGTNSMQILDSNHRGNFLSFVSDLSAGGGTPSHWMFSQADKYMRSTVNSSGPWSGNPGGKDEASTTYLGCRRNYHIMMTDGRWNSLTEDLGDTTRGDSATNISLPNGTVYGGSNEEEQKKTALYRDKYNKTLADWAFYSWGTALQTTKVKGAPQPTTEYSNAPQSENFGKDTKGQDAVLERFWNPRYNPATWPHMVTYTIGFSKLAHGWSTDIAKPSNLVPFGYDAGANGDLPSLITGQKSWPELKTSTEGNNAIDLWHAALNGRGRFYAVEQGEDLVKAFREIFQQINTQTDPEMTSTAASGSNNTLTSVDKYTGNYEPKNAWKGFVTAATVNADSDDTITAPAGWSGKNTADRLDAMTVSDRVVWSWSDKWTGSAYKGGVPFLWANDESNLSAAQKLWLQRKPDGSSTDEGATKGSQRLNYIRGDRSLEGSEGTNGYTTAKPFRERKSIQGDIINSTIWYTGAPASNYALKGYAEFTQAQKDRLPMIYVGGNDGMLHGFSTKDGNEKIAYVPQGMLPSLGRLTDPSYNQKHRFFVDGSPMTGDVNLGSNTNPNWRTLLVGSLGAGGKGYFVLDVTNPASGFTASNAANTLVKLDRTRSTDSDMGAQAPNCALSTMEVAEKAACAKAVEEDRDIGNITALPVLDEGNPMRTTQITLLNNGRWAVVMGNGYNSANQRPVLLIQYLDGDRELKRLVATGNTSAADCSATSSTKTKAECDNISDNGLSAPRLVDINGDGMPDVAYAGDNRGNMWKFDLTSANDSKWNTAFNNQPLFTARGPASLGSTRTLTQHITVAPTVRANDRKMTVVSGSNQKTLPVGGMMVSFGTGRNVTKLDESDLNVQTLYSVLDNTRYKLVESTLNGQKVNRLQVHAGDSGCTSAADECVVAPKALGIGVTEASLAEQVITDLNNGEFGAIGAKNTDNKLGTANWSSFNGWYLDLPAVGERLLKNMEFYDNTNILAVYSQVPAKGSDVDPNVETCEANTVDEERQYRTFINIMDGSRPSVQLVDKNGDGLYNASDLNVSRRRVSKGSHTLISKKNRTADLDSKNEKELLARMPEQSLRPSWRQLR